MPLLFVFDMDDVLYDYDWRARMAGLTALTGHSLDELRRRWWNDAGEWAAEAGHYPDAEAYHAAFTAAIGYEVPVADWVANRRSAMRPFPRSLAAVERAAELGEVTLLTNAGALVGERLPEIAPELVPLFGAEHLRASSSYGARKPDPVVFSRVLAAYGADPGETFFVDDLPENVRGAESVGITGHVFRTGDVLLDAIESFARARA